MHDHVSAGMLFREGRLRDAVDAATARVRREPAAAIARVLLAELLLFVGSLERADGQLDIAGTIDPSLAIAMAEFRQLLRAEQARVQLLAEGRVPEFLGTPTDSQRAALAAVVAVRSGDLATAGAYAAAAEAARPATAFLIGAQRINDLRDADDLIGGSLEVLTPTGRYLWIPFERVMEMTPHPPERIRDLFWRRVTLTVESGPSGEVYVPALYLCDAAEADEAVRLGRATDWRELANGLTRGVGQRVFLAGDTGVPAMELTNLTRTT